MEASVADNMRMLASGNAQSLTILSCFLLAVMALVGIIFFWTLRKEIKGLFVKCWTTTGADRSSENQATASLNDIIFDPEEEQQANLQESLLPSST